MIDPATSRGTGRASSVRRCAKTLGNPLWIGSMMLAFLGNGCTSLQEFIHNGLKVGPNYQRPPAPIASEWIDAKNPRVKSVPADYSAWWSAFHDPVLNDFVKTAYEQNVTLRVAAARVLEARATRAVAVGNLFPQQQTLNGTLADVQTSKNVANPPPKSYFENLATNFNATWELDFWGKIRRIIESADDAVESSVDDYDNVMVSLIGDVATAYTTYRIIEQQLVYAKQNIELQRGSLKIATERWKAGQTGEMGVVQATSLLEQFESTIPLLDIALRQTNNTLCVLLGIPPTELAAKLGKAPIPAAPPDVLVGIPADLIRRRPDLRSAERLVAAQNAQIGVAESDWYPSFFINGTIGYQARNINQLFTSNSVTGSFGPGFQWNVLNYGRILNNVRVQDTRTQQLIGVYQQKVLSAAREVENGMTAFLNARDEAAHLAASVKAAERAVKLATDQYNVGAIDYTPVFVTEQFLAQQQNLYAQAQGDIALGMINIYRALGGGWELRLADAALSSGTPGYAASARAAPATLRAPAAEPTIVHVSAKTGVRGAIPETAAVGQPISGWRTVRSRRGTDNCAKEGAP